MSFSLHFSHPHGHWHPVPVLHWFLLDSVVIRDHCGNNSPFCLRLSQSLDTWKACVELSLNSFSKAEETCALTIFPCYLSFFFLGVLSIVDFNLSLSFIILSQCLRDILRFIFSLVNMCLCEYYECAGAHRNQKRGLVSLELEVQAVVNHPCENWSGSSARAAEFFRLSSLSSPFKLLCQWYAILLLFACLCGGMLHYLSYFSHLWDKLMNLSNLIEKGLFGLRVPGHTPLWQESQNSKT